MKSLFYLTVLEYLLVHILKISHISFVSQEDVIKLFQEQSNNKGNKSALKSKAQIKIFLLRFAIREGGHTVGAGVVAKIFE